MSMTEIVSFLDLSVFPSVALIFFLAAFFAILWRVLSKPRSESEMEANIPLNDDVVLMPRYTVKNEQADDKGVSRG
ncbi:MAG: hypothetical protein P1U42_00380 [Phycisphaerales bacterium]|nr:hypothetical protein [Phycisphaerales bacterium]